MSKKGQALALFITIIPVIFIVLAFIYESSVFINKKTNIVGILEVVALEARKNNLTDDEIKKLLEENKINGKDIMIVSNDDERKIIVKIKYPVINKTYEIISSIEEAV